MNETIKDRVRAGYGRIARGQSSSCCGGGSACCGGGASSRTIAEKIGYSPEELEQVPEGANLGLGCGNPVALAALEQGQTVLDLGSGAGFDCFLAARAVGPTGRVIGVDMTPEMIAKARSNAERAGVRNVEFRLGEIEALPVADRTIDVILSNCVINLSPDKPRVFAEAYRVLKPGGVLAVSDIVLKRPLPQAIASSVSAYVGCIAGASRKEDYLAMLGAAGFSAVEIIEETPFYAVEESDDPFLRGIREQAGLSEQELRQAAQSVVSLKLRARKAP
ncbi:MAG: arsenite methyltransferase [Desulfobacterales bacterium]